MLNLGDGSFTSPVTYAASSRARDVALGDLNEDGRLDLISCWSDRIAVWPGQGGSSFGSLQTFSVAPLAHTLALADFDGDFHGDVAVRGSDQITILRGDGSGTMTLWQSVNSPGIDLAVADLNRDFRPDLVVVPAFVHALLHP